MVKKQQPMVPRLVRWAVVTLLLLAAVGCKSVEFYEKRNLSDPLMALDGGPTETHFLQKTFYSREGAIGGFGSTAGGGCGCY